MKPGSPPLFFYYKDKALQPGDIQRLARRPEVRGKQGKAHHLRGIDLLIVLNAYKGPQSVGGGMPHGKAYEIGRAHV